MHKNKSTFCCEKWFPSTLFIYVSSSGHRVDVELGAVAKMKRRRESAINEQEIFGEVTLKIEINLSKSFFL